MMLSHLPVELFEYICDLSTQSGIKNLMATSRGLYSPAKQRFYIKITLTSFRSITIFINHLETLIDDHGRFRDRIVPTRSLYLQSGWKKTDHYGIGVKSTKELDYGGSHAATRIIKLLSPYLETLVLYRIGCEPRFPLSSLTCPFPSLRKLVALEQSIIVLQESPSVLSNITHLYIGWDIANLNIRWLPRLEHLRVDYTDATLPQCIPSNIKTQRLAAIITDLAYVAFRDRPSYNILHESLQSADEEKLKKLRKWMGDKGEVCVGDPYTLFVGGVRIMLDAWEANSLSCAWTSDWNPSEEAKRYIIVMIK